METYVVLAEMQIRSMRGLTAFSALPDAPVLEVCPSAWRRSVVRLRRMASRVHAIRTRASVATAPAAARMSVCEG